MSKQCTVALNCYAAKALPVKYQVRPTDYKSRIESFGLPVHSYSGCCIYRLTVA